MRIVSVKSFGPGEEGSTSCACYVDGIVHRRRGVEISLEWLSRSHHRISTVD